MVYLFHVLLQCGSLRARTMYMNNLYTSFFKYIQYHVIKNKEKSTTCAFLTCLHKSHESVLFSSRSLQCGSLAAQTDSPHGDGTPEASRARAGV